MPMTLDNFVPHFLLGLLLLCTLVGCSVEDSRTASEAQIAFIGMTQVDLETCLGVPDAEKAFGAVDVLTYRGNSTSNNGVTLDLPVIGGITLSGGGYCHTTVRIENGTVAEVRYTGETSAAFSPDSYCAPIVRSCVKLPEPVR